MIKIPFYKQTKELIGIAPKFVMWKTLIKHILIDWHKIFTLCMSPSGLFIMQHVPMTVAQKLTIKYLMASLM